MKLGALIALGAFCATLCACGGARQTRPAGGDRYDCTSPTPVIPLRSFGNDPQALRVVRAPTRGLGRYTHRFEREPSGTTETLRAVVADHLGKVITVGNRGTALVRDPAKGWRREATSTEEGLHAIIHVQFRPEDPVGVDHGDNPPIHVAVGAHGTALVRSADGVWHAEQTGTDKDLFAVWHEGMRTLAVGAGGTMVQRSADGVWRPVRTRTTADLHGINQRRVVGAGGVVVDCRWFGSAPTVCIPRPAVTDRDLYAVSENGYYFGDGVLLAPTLKPWGEDQGASVPAGDQIRAAWSRSSMNFEDQIAVGRGGAVWLVSSSGQHKKPFERVQLPSGVDLHGVAFTFVDGFLVGDNGTIVHVAVDGVEIENHCLL